MNRAAPVTRLIRFIAQRLGYHPADPRPDHVDLAGRKALVIATNHAALDIGRPTGVFASELTTAYYAFVDAGMIVDVASPAGGVIPVEPLSLRSVVRTASDDRMLDDPRLRSKIMASSVIGDLDMHDYDIVYLAGGWGAAFDLGYSPELATKITEANAAGLVIGGVCHGPLGLINATGPDGRPLVAGRHVTAVSDRQVRQLGIASTPQHPETELRRRARCTSPGPDSATSWRTTGSSTATLSPAKTRTPVRWWHERCSGWPRSEEVANPEPAEEPRPIQA